MDFATLKNQVEKEIKIAAEKFVDQKWCDADFYRNYLAQTYYYVCHSTRLLALASARFRVVDDALHQRFIEHAGEEKRHELLAKKDLEKLGTDLSSMSEFAATQALYQTQYYWIEHEGPIAFFGYILALEGIAVFGAGRAYEALKAGGYDKSAQFLKVHANEDPEHFEKALDSIAGAVRNNGDFDKISKNFHLSLELYFTMLRQCAENVSQAGKSKAA